MYNSAIQTDDWKCEKLAYSGSHQGFWIVVVEPKTYTLTFILNNVRQMTQMHFSTYTYRNTDKCKEEYDFTRTAANDSKLLSNQNILNSSQQSLLS